MEHSVHDGITISPYPKGLNPPISKTTPTPPPPPHFWKFQNPLPPRLPSYTYAHTRVRAHTHAHFQDKIFKWPKILLHSNLGYMAEPWQEHYHKLQLNVKQI